MLGLGWARCWLSGCVLVCLLGLVGPGQLFANMCGFHVSYSVVVSCGGLGSCICLCMCSLCVGLGVGSVVG